MRVLKLFSVCLLSVVSCTVMATIPVLKQSENGKLYDDQGNAYLLEGTYLVPDNNGVMIEKNCSESIYDSDPNSIPDESTIINNTDPGKGCTIRKENSKTPIPLFPNLKSPMSKTSETILACDYYATWAPPLAYGPPVAMGSHIGSAWFKVGVSWTKNVGTSNGVRFWSTSNVWQTQYWPNSGMTVYTGNAAASIYTFFKSYTLGVTGTVAVC